jgi:hypothetical protein
MACPPPATATRSARSVRSSIRYSQGHLTLLCDVPVNSLMLKFLRSTLKSTPAGHPVQPYSSFIGSRELLNHPNLCRITKSKPPAS